MIVLSATTDNLQVVLGAAVAANQARCTSSWRDITTTAYTPGRTLTLTNNTTAVNAVPSPAVSTQRVVDLLNVYNADTAAMVVTVQFLETATIYILWRGVLQPGETLTYHEGIGWAQSRPSGVALVNQSTADQSIAAATSAYLAGSAIVIPSTLLRIGSQFQWDFSVSKTAAGTAANTWFVRCGTNGSVADTAVCTFATGVGTAAVDVGTGRIVVTCRGPLSASGIFQGNMLLSHNLAATGLLVIPAASVNSISAAFNVTTAGLIIGLSCTTAASTVLTFQQVQAFAGNL